MPQLDKELFIDYIFYILLILIHLYTGSLVNKDVLRIYGRKFLIKNFLWYEEYNHMNYYFTARIQAQIHRDWTLDILDPFMRMSRFGLNLDRWEREVTWDNP